MFSQLQTFANIQVLLFLNQVSWTYSGQVKTSTDETSLKRVVICFNWGMEDDISKK